MERQFHTPAPGSSPCSARSPSAQVNISVASQNIQGLETSTLILLMSLGLQKWGSLGTSRCSDYVFMKTLLLFSYWSSTLDHMVANRYPKLLIHTLCLLPSQRDCYTLKSSVRFWRRFKDKPGDFPGDPVVKNPLPPAGDTSSIPNAKGQLSLCATTTETLLHSMWAATTKARLLEPALHGKKPPQWDSYALQLESSLCSPQLEKAYMQQWKPRAAKKTNEKKENLIYPKDAKERP